MQVRVLTPSGIERFEAYLDRLRAGATDPSPQGLLEGAESSAAATAAAFVEDRPFESRREAAEYLDRALAPLDPAEKDHGRGLWAWLSLFYFDRLCPPDRSGKRTPGKNYRHVPSTHWRHFYRHLLLGPYRIYRICGDGGRCMLAGAFGSHGDFAEQLASRQELLTNPGLIELSDQLYFDRFSGRPKPGASDRRKRGNLRRLIGLVDQLDLTYDLPAMDAGEIAALLPPEFDGWRQ